MSPMNGYDFAERLRRVLERAREREGEAVDATNAALHRMLTRAEERFADNSPIPPPSLSIP